MDSNLSRFLQAQEKDYKVALSEIKSGKKISHWMWYIFPQIQGLGFSDTSKYYALKNIQEAINYLNHPTLGIRLKEITNELLKLEQTDANSIFGNPDDLKLKSCMTLFDQIDDSDTNLFKNVLIKFFNGSFDNKTLRLLKQ